VNSQDSNKNGIPNFQNTPTDRRQKDMSRITENATSHSANGGSGYDIIGDIHGHALELRALLSDMGYGRHGRGYRHPERKAIFVGDFVDRGPAIGEVLEIVRSMVDADDAFAVMGNHEYNAIAFHTPVPENKNAWFRPHTEKNLKQHEATLTQLSPSQLSDAIHWFRSLPVALEIEGVRVAHAAWQAADIARINRALESEGKFTTEFLLKADEEDSELRLAIENVLKGPELKLPAGHFIRDKSGHQRDKVRIKWYENGIGRTYSRHHLGNDEVPDLSINPDDLRRFETYPSDAAPVFVGHYWLTGTPRPLAANVACTDYSVAKGGKLVAYRWNGESTLGDTNFHWA
jgi:hypothetical protein